MISNTLSHCSRLDLIGRAGVTLAVHVAHETGLIARMRRVGPADVETLCRDQNFNPIAVLEWLRLMRSTPWVAWNPRTNTYALTSAEVPVLPSPQAVEALFAELPPLRRVVSELVGYMRGATTACNERRGFFLCMLWLDAALGVKSNLENAA